MQYYKKSSTTNNWELIWRAIPPERVTNITSNVKDIIVITTFYGNIVTLHPDNDKVTFIYRKTNETRFNDFCLIYPAGQIVVTLAHNDEISSWAVADGVKVRNESTENLS